MKVKYLIKYLVMEWGVHHMGYKLENDMVYENIFCILIK
jgi:hypothetical protein